MEQEEVSKLFHAHVTGYGNKQGANYSKFKMRKSD